MRVNKFRPHVLVLPEDRANSEIATGFQLSLDSPSRIQVLPEAGGWHKVLDIFRSDHIGDMNRVPNRYMILLIDFDGDGTRFDDARRCIPPHLSDRVFILGTWTEPDKLKSGLGSYEQIGAGLARDCRQDTGGIWSHELLRHNDTELARLRQRVRPILF